MIAFENNQKYPLFRANGSPLKARKERSPEVAYRRLSIEASLQDCTSSSEVSALEAELESVDREIHLLDVPMQHSQLFFSIKSHVDDVRARLAARLVQTRSQKPKVA